MTRRTTSSPATTATPRCGLHMLPPLFASPFSRHPSLSLVSVCLLLLVLLLAHPHPAQGAPTLAPRLDARADFRSREFFDLVLMGVCPDAPTMPASFHPKDRAHPVVRRFIHVPKTGGTSLNAVLEAAARMEKKMFCILLASQANSQARFFQADKPFCDILSSEFDGSHRFQLPETLTGQIMDFTLLRDPVRRAFSQYQHHLVGGRYNKDDFAGKHGANRAREHEERLSAFLTDGLCGLNEKSLAYCDSLKDPTKCSGTGWCGIFKNHQANVITGARLFTDDFVEQLFKSQHTLLCAAETQLNSFGIVGITEYFTASVCLILHEFKWTSTFERCCAGKGAAIPEGDSFRFTCPELWRVSQENVRTPQRRNDNGDGNGEGDIGEGDGRNNNNNNNNEDEGAAHYMDQYFNNPAILALAKQANIVDCHLYNFGLRKFKMQVAAMEADTKMRFLPDVVKELQCGPLALS